jgi:hypothetical protein
MKAKVNVAQIVFAVLCILSGVTFGGLGVTAVRANEGFESVYPGRYVANCKPAPVVGCVCVTEVGDPLEDVETSRMLEWMRRTCTAVTQPGSLR